MTTIVMKDGAVLFVDGAVAGDEACCCGCSCPECNEGVSIQLNSDPGSSAVCDGCLGCLNPPMYHAYYNDDPDNTHGGMEASMYCEPDAGSPHGIIWRVSVYTTFANFFPDSEWFDKSCTKTYTGTVQADSDCLPVAGAVDLTLDFSEDNGACDKIPTPTVTVIRA